MPPAPQTQSPDAPQHTTLTELTPKVTYLYSVAEEGTRLDVEHVRDTAKAIGSLSPGHVRHTAKEIGRLDVQLVKDMTLAAQELLPAHVSQ